MQGLNKAIERYRELINEGVIVNAYSEILQFMLLLKNSLKKQYPDHGVSSAVYQGTMDISYFTFTPPELMKKKLKVAIIFRHHTISFEVWLCGANKQIQEYYWKEIKSVNWNKYTMPTSLKGQVSIIEKIIESNPDFERQALLIKSIEKSAVSFINEMYVLLNPFVKKV